MVRSAHPTSPFFFLGFIARCISDYFLGRTWFPPLLMAHPRHGEDLHPAAPALRKTLAHSFTVEPVV